MDWHPSLIRALPLTGFRLSIRDDVQPPNENETEQGDFVYIHLVAHSYGCYDARPGSGRRKGLSKEGLSPMRLRVLDSNPNGLPSDIQHVSMHCAVLACM